MSDTERNGPEPMPELTNEEKSFVERVTTSYAPPPMSASQRVAFRARLDTRLEQRGRRWRLTPLVGLAAAAAAVAFWLALPGSTDPALGTSPGAQLEATPSASADSADSVESALFAFDASDDRDDSLPDDYAAIASLLLDGA